MAKPAALGQFGQALAGKDDPLRSGSTRRRKGPRIRLIRSPGLRDPARRQRKCVKLWAGHASDHSSSRFQRNPCNNARHPRNLNRMKFGQSDPHIRPSMADGICRSGEVLSGCENFTALMIKRVGASISNLVSPPKSSELNFARGRIRPQMHAQNKGVRILTEKIGSDETWRNNFQVVRVRHRLIRSRRYVLVDGLHPDLSAKTRRRRVWRQSYLCAHALRGLLRYWLGIRGRIECRSYLKARARGGL